MGYLCPIFIFAVCNVSTPPCVFVCVHRGWLNLLFSVGAFTEGRSVEAQIAPSLRSRCCALLRFACHFSGGPRFEMGLTIREAPTLKTNFALRLHGTTNGQIAFCRAHDMIT